MGFEAPGAGTQVPGFGFRVWAIASGACCLIPSGETSNIPELQRYLAHKNPPPPQDPTVAPCLGLYGGSRGGGVLMSEVPL